MKNNQNKFNTILITGGAGFIGTHLCATLKEHGFSVISLDRRVPERPVEGVVYEKGDIRDLSHVDALAAKADVIVHLAATVSVPLCQEDPAESYSNNVAATVGLLECAVKAGRTRGSRPLPFVFASSAALYGRRGDDGRALAETDVPESFLSFYAAQKHAAEHAVRQYGEHCDVPATVFRFFNVYGQYQDPHSPYSGVITLFTKLAKEGRELPLHDGGVQTRDFISVKDIVKAIRLALETPLSHWKSDPMNLGTGQVITVRQLAEMVRNAQGSRSEIINAPARNGDVQHSKADTTAARLRLGFTAGLGLAQGLTEL